MVTYYTTHLGSFSSGLGQQARRQAGHEIAGVLQIVQAEGFGHQRHDPRLVLAASDLGDIGGESHGNRQNNKGNLIGFVAHSRC